MPARLAASFTTSHSTFGVMPSPHTRPDLLIERNTVPSINKRSEEHTSELQSPCNLVCRLLLEKNNDDKIQQVFCNFGATAARATRHGVREHACLAERDVATLMGYTDSLG